MRTKPAFLIMSTSRLNGSDHPQATNMMIPITLLDGESEVHNGIKFVTVMDGEGNTHRIKEMFVVF